jgi:broad specificity phosphatase PhoE
MRKLYILILSLFCSVTLLSCGAKEEAETTVYFVRHAEKDTMAIENPSLTVDGVMRSVDLANWFVEKPLDSIFSSDYKRTIETANPVAEKKGMEVTKYNPSDFDAFAKTLKSLDGKHVLVVGHSNTLLPQIEALGGKKPQESISDFEYDKIFEVHIKGDEVSVKTHSYGSPYTTE